MRFIRLRKWASALSVVMIIGFGAACSESDTNSKAKKPLAKSAVKSTAVASASKSEIKVMPGTLPAPTQIPVPIKITEAPSDIIGSLIPEMAKYKKGIFWKIERPGYRPSYLLGTMHSEHPQILALTKVIKKQFDAAETLCTEVKMDMTAMMGFAASMIYRNGQTLQKNIDAKLYQQVVQHSKTLGIEMDELNKMKPWVVNLRLSMPKSEGGTALDMRLMFNATKQKKQLCGLETIKEQIDIFAKEVVRDQVKALRLTVDNFALVRKQIPIMRNFYLKGDLYSLASLIRDSPVQMPKKDMERFMFKLVVRRNIIMVNRMQPYLKKGNAFIAVGALHLTGKGGLLRMLDKQGYILTRLY